MTLWIIFWITFAAFVFGTYWDFSASVRFPYYSQEESNKLLRDKYGFFALGRSMLIYAGLAAASLALAFFADPLYGTALLALLALRSIILGFNNRKNARNNREKQINLFRSFRDSGQFKGFTQPRTREGRTWYREFAWHWSENPNAEQACVELQDWLKALVILPEGQWFK